MLLALKGGLNLDIKNRLSPNIKTKRDLCWVAGVSGFGNAMLVLAATKNDDLRSYLGYVSEVYRRLAEGGLSAKEAQTLLQARSMPNIMSDRIRGDFAEVERLHKAKVEAAESALIAFAKVAARNIPECNNGV